MIFTPPTSRLLATVEAYRNQTYVLAMRFAAPASGWHFDETLTLYAGMPGRGYHGSHTFSRSGLHFLAGDALVVTTVQADWVGVTFGDWRTLHGVVWSLRMCGVPQNPIYGG